ncbi:RsmB/NOP family class I SAM-dependent RNA methyltransferase [Paenibacillus sp. M1]|uniref:RsmB/NOP family class I SAM-dependent RNA methyltransferase n=1 Tax=Paenibacillus haidiansis TaxID=1574488 RepID=A0ABU7VP30_9BACL
MAVQLPAAFVTRMQALLGDEYDEFLSSYDSPRYAGIRVNTLKISVDEFRAISPFELKAIPWCETGFYVDESAKPGKHPYYHAGLYYIQEPSAMAPAEALDVLPGDRVLDLCAAPGGKSTQIAAKLGGKGLLVTNDISTDRTKALAKNMELYGVRNAVVLNETPERIAAAFPHYFNKILIDAPCSGEGMFRKDEDMARQWETHSIAKCTLMQRDILSTAAALLSPGGRIVYSTCTFAPEENEAQIAEFLEQNPDFEIVPLDETTGFSPGRPDWVALLANGSEVLEQTGAPVPEISEAAVRRTAGCGRLWPHKVAGEGHFVAVLRHKGEPVQLNEADPADVMTPHFDQGGGKSRRKGRPDGPGGPGKKGPDEAEMLGRWHAFASEQLAVEPAGSPLLFGGNVYLSPLTRQQLSGLKTVRPGWYVGTVKNGRFQPGHPLAAALHPEESLRALELSLPAGEAVRYLKGETLEIPASRIACAPGIKPKGYVLITVDGYALGWGKWLDGLLKNEYPAGWRWT